DRARERLALEAASHYRPAPRACPVSARHPADEAGALTRRAGLRASRRRGALGNVPDRATPGPLKRTASLDSTDEERRAPPCRGDGSRHDHPTRLDGREDL